MGLPWAVLPEVDYLLATHVGSAAQDAFLSDLGRGEWAVEWGADADLERAHEIDTRYRSLRLGLVDAAVIAVAERLRARRSRPWMCATSARCRSVAARD